MFINSAIEKKYEVIDKESDIKKIIIYLIYDNLNS